MALIDNIVAYWKMDVDNATQIDSVGSNDGTITNADYTGAGRISGAFDFDGDGDLMTLDSTDALAAGGTLAFWIKFNSMTVPATFQTMVSEAGDNDRYLAFSSTTNIAIQGDLGGQAKQFTVGAMSAGNWYHFIITMDGSNNVNVYLDNTVSSSGAQQINGTHSIDQFMKYSNSASNSCNGILDEIGLWDRVLTSGERAELYNGGSGLQYPFGVAGTNALLNIGDDWKTVDAAQINIGDTWKSVEGMQVNIGDTWKTIF